MDIHRVYAFFFRFFRARRMRRFARTFRPTASTRVLDVGGTPGIWETVRPRPRVTFLNHRAPTTEQRAAGGGSFVRGDATRIGFPDDSFDIVFSNSVIEHLGDRASQDRFAREVSRVGRGLWIQTPSRSFFVEPHLITPFVHFFPRSLQRRLLRNFTVWGWLTRPTRARVDAFLDEVRLLSAREVSNLFPDCELQRERFLGLTKDYVAVRRTR